MAQWQYELLLARRLHHDQLVWQVPAISLTAQAFLFTISLAHDSSRLARLLSSFLSVVTAAMSVQLMARHRFAELTMARRLEEFERAHGLPTAAFAEVGGLDRGPWLARRLAALRAFDVWVWGLASFGGVGALVAVLAVIYPGVFG